LSTVPPLIPVKYISLLHYLPSHRAHHCTNTPRSTHHTPHTTHHTPDTTHQRHYTPHHTSLNSLKTPSTLNPLVSSYPSYLPCPNLPQLPPAIYPFDQIRSPPYFCHRHQHLTQYIPH
jgi:hypothetical protein